MVILFLFNKKDPPESKHYAILHYFLIVHHLHPRCKYVQEKCRTDLPFFREITEDHFVACHYADVLDLKGIE